MDLENRVAIVTGGARGIGLAIAKRLSGAGAAVVIADIEVERANREAASLGDGRSIPIECDVSNPEAVKAMVGLVMERYSRIDILINNAGVSGGSVPVQEVTDELWSLVLGVHLSGTFYCCRAVIPHMRERGYGRIVNISSIAGKEGNPNMAPYSAAKAGTIGLTKTIGKELAKTGILVNVVTPGSIDTGLLNNLPPTQARYIIERIPMGRQGRVEEVAALVHWLASDECSFSTGAVFDLSGGRATY